jgi:hypothetical protein
MNPARDVEAFAVTAVREWVGDRGAVIDLSHGHGPDFCIEYHDGRRALGEVGWHEDPEIQAMWQRTHRESKPQQIPLRAGLGQWGVTLVRGASINQLYAQLPTFVEALVEQQYSKLDINGSWPRTDLADTARRLGLTHIGQVQKEERWRFTSCQPQAGRSTPMRT